MEERYFIPVGYVIIPSFIFGLSIITLFSYGLEVFLLILFLFSFELVSFFILQKYYLKGEINNLYRMILSIIPSIIFLLVIYYFGGVLPLITLLSFFALIVFIAINIEKPKVFEETKKRLSTEDEKKIIEKIQNSVKKINIKIKQIEKNDIFTLPEKTILLNECKTTLNLINEIKSYKESLSSDCKTFIEKIETEIGILNKKIVALYQNIYERKLSRKIEDRITIINECCNKIENMYTYLIYSDKINLIKICKHHLKSIKDLENNNDNFSKELLSIISDSINEINIKIKKIENYNKEFIKNRKIKYKYLLKTEKYPLDDKQQTAVIKDDTYNLVLAGAGSGKTEVLTNRIAYLIERKPDTIQSDKILALAFQRDAREEMEKRLEDRWKFNLKIKTFHAFGKELIEKYTGFEAKLLSKNKKNYEFLRKKLIKELYEEELKKSQFQEYVIDYMKYIGSEDTLLEIPDFKTKEENYNYRINQKIKTLNGWEVRSPAERDIMNFFLSHKLDGEDIEIKYEIPPEGMYYENEDGILKNLYPDFLFPKYNIYLEHWAVNKDNKSRYPNYEKGMNQKIKMFSEQDKYILFETSAYEYEENPDRFKKLLEKRFIDAIKKKEPGKKCELSTIKYVELVNKVWYDSRDVEKIPNDISKFIEIAKVHDFYPKDLKQRLQNKSWLPIQKTFAKFAIIIYEKYRNKMKEIDKIDFEDMINNSIDILKENKDFYRNSFDHILIDEYQDISEQRYKLIYELLKKNPKCKLFCVGDDWQSIAGFSGSNLNYIINFDKFFRNNASTKLPINYRSNKSIVETGVEIINHNSNKLDKETKSNNEKIGKIQIYIAPKTDKKDFIQYYQEITESCLNIVQELLDNKDEKHNPNDIMILLRIFKNSYLKKILLERAKEKNIPVYCPKDEDKLDVSKIPLMTVHESKGLEAKTVFILDVIKGKFGFPCELESPVIFDIVKKETIEDKESEERRLFYVAVTRAKNDVFIYTQESEESKFLNEINKHVDRSPIDFSTSKTEPVEEKIIKKYDKTKKSIYGGVRRVDYKSRRCENCNRIIPKDSENCPECGYKQLPIIN